MFRLSSAPKTLKGNVHLPSSKSLSNRAIIIQALCEEDFNIKGLSKAEDSQTLRRLLLEDDLIMDAGGAGTTYRFLTAYLALQDKDYILTGSKRMLERPVGVLVDALNELGARIEYLGKEGFPPIQIHAPSGEWQERLSMDAGISSQYISAILMIAPLLPKGLTLHLEGEIVSRPYIQMTLNLMDYFGVKSEWTGAQIRIAPQRYQARDFRVEADWSAASYYYAMAALSEETDLLLEGLYENTVQGDAVLVDLMKQFGVLSSYEEAGVRLLKTERPIDVFDYDFLECPDLAQTFAVLCAAKGVRANLRGLRTLRIKETDRIEALRVELAKFGAELETSDQRCILLKGVAAAKKKPVRLKTYKDHRMAMAFAPLVWKGYRLDVEDPQVVRKSYPSFWEDLQSLGLEVIDLDQK